MILVTGATGNVGSALLRRLPPGEVRALAHSTASRDAIERHGVEGVEGDFDQPETLERAMAGCDDLFLLSPPHPDQAAREKAAIDAARRAGVQRVVAVSIMGSDHASPASICRWHAEIDEHIALSGLNYTILRPTGYMQVHLMPVATVKSSGVWYGMTGDGAAAFIDSADVAAVAAAVLTSTGHTGRTYELTGPAAITMADAAATLSRTIERDVAYIDLPAEHFHAGMLGAGLPPWLADMAVALYAAIREGHAATVSNSVEELTGFPSRRYQEFLDGCKDAF